MKFIKTSMTFLGNLAIMDSCGVTIDLREAGGDIFFVGGKIILRKLLTSTTTPARIWFVNTNIVATGSSFIFNNPEIYFAGNVSLTNSFSIVTLKKMVLLPFTKMIAYPDCAINLNQISIPYEGTRLEIRRSSLNFTSTSTSAIRIVTPYAHNSQGTLALDGKCRFSSTTNNTLIFDKYAKLELLSSAELTLAQGTKLVFE